jgi:hypothetical protein
MSNKNLGAYLGVTRQSVSMRSVGVPVPTLGVGMDVDDGEY